MKRLFYAGAGVLAVFEMANVYVVMPMPYSQRWHSIDLAYFLYSWRWLFRGLAAVLMLAGLAECWRARGWRKGGAAIAALLAGAAAYEANFELAADAIFLQPSSVTMAPPQANVVEPARLVVGLS